MKRFRIFKLKTISLSGGVAISSALHLAILFALFAIQRIVTATPAIDPNFLQLDLLGMIGDRQQEERVETPPPPMVETPPEEVAQPQPLPVPPPPSPDEVVTPEEIPPPPPPKPRPAAKKPPPPKKQAAAAQKQVTVSKRQIEASVLREYLKGLSVKISANLVYPPEGKAEGLTGSTDVAFTVRESGRVQPNSAKVKRSSGSKILDQAAIRAVTTAGDFSPPPKKLEVVITIRFQKDFNFLR